MKPKQAFFRACALILIPALLAGCALTPEAKASRAAASWLYDLQSGRTVSSPSNSTFLYSFENANLEELEEADQAFEKDYLKNTIRSWQAVEAYQQDGKIIVCMLVNFADPASLTKESLMRYLKDHPLASDENKEAKEENGNSAKEEVQEADSVKAAEGDSAEETVLIEETADLQSQLDDLTGTYKPEVQAAVLEAVKEAPEIAEEIYFQVDPDSMAILSIY